VFEKGQAIAARPAGGARRRGAGDRGGDVTDRTSTRTELQARKQELQARIARVHDDLTRASETPEQDFAEQAVQRENDEVLAQLEASARAEVARIDRALARVANGTYGLCASCGGDIDPARLHVVPDADRCVKCSR
jgi:RNA polymerase-binding transcription factor DksA